MNKYKYKVIVPSYEEWNAVLLADEDSIKEFQKLPYVCDLKVQYNYQFHNLSIDSISFEWCPNNNQYEEIVIINKNSCFMYDISDPEKWKVVTDNEIKREGYLIPCE